MNPVPGRVSSRRRWCSFLLCKKRAHRGDWAKTTHSNLSCGGGASTCRNGQARRRHLTKRSFISKVELMATPRALSRITTTERGRVTWRRSGRCSVCTGFVPGHWRRQRSFYARSNQPLSCCVPDSSRASHLFATLVERTSCLKHLACTFRLF